MTDVSRRQFLGGVGGGVVATAGLSAPASAQDTPVVEMGNNYFDPIGLHVEPGTTVRFELAAGSHSATAYPDRIPGDAAEFDSGTISEGHYDHTFETPGTYDYYCIPHKTIGMVGRIVVGTPGGPAEDGPIPDGEVPTSEAIIDQGAVANGSDTDGSGSSDGGMMRPGGAGMMSGRPGRWVGVLPAVGGLGMLGIVGSVLYLLANPAANADGGDDPALLSLRREYARGEIDDAEYQRRRERLDAGEGNGPE